MSKIKMIPLLAFSLSMLLASCQGSADSSMSLSTASSAISEKREDYVAEDSVSGLISTLQELKRSSNFTLHNDYDDSTYLYDEVFYEKEGTGKAYVNLPSHRDESKQLAYVLNFTESGTPYLSNMGYYTDAYGERHELTFDTFRVFDALSGDLSESAFVDNGDTYLSGDESVLSSFTNLYQVSIAKISFWFSDKNKTLNFELFDSSSSSLTTGSFFHINNTKDEIISSFVESFSWESAGKALTNEQASTLFDANFSCTTEITKTFGNADTLIAQVDFKCNEDTIYVHSVDSPTNNPTEYYSYISKNGAEGRAYYHGLNAQNETTEDDSRYFFSQWPLPKDLDIQDFRLCGDGQYRYFSIEPNLVYQTLVHTTINDRSCSFEEAILNLVDNKVTGVTMNSDTGSVFNARYKAVTTLKMYDGISMPSPYEEKGLSEVERAMSYFDGNTPFQVTKSNKPAGTEPTRRTTYTFDGWTYLIEEETYNSETNSFDKSVHGYCTKKDGTILPFRKIKGKDKLVQSEEVIQNDTIANHFPRMADARTIGKNAEGKYVFRNLITSIIDTLWISNNVIPSTVSMMVEGGKLTSMQYGVNYSSDDGEYLTFSYDNIALSETIDPNKIGPMELTCYEDDSPEEWKDLVDYIGQEYASLIPYYYDKKNVGNWYAEPRYSSGTAVPDANEVGQIDFDSPLIGIGFYCVGSNVPTSVLDEGFQKAGFMKVTSTEKIDVGYRDDDYQANGYDSPIYLIDPSKQTIWIKEGEGGEKLRVIYDSDVAFFHFNPNQKANYVLGSGLLIQPLDKDGNVVIHRD